MRCACLEKQIDRLDAEEKRITSTRQMLNHILTNHVDMTEAQVEEYLEQMDKLEQEGTVVQTKNVGRDIMAGFKTLVGGEIAGYTEMLNEARQIAVKRMVDEAKQLGADAVIDVKYGSSQVMAGAAEVIAYGTAVKIVKE